MAKYRVWKVCYRLAYWDGGVVEAESGKQALDIHTSRGGDYEWCDESEDIAIDHYAVDLATPDNPVPFLDNETYRLNDSDIVRNRGEEFLLVSRLGWRHS